MPLSDWGELAATEAVDRGGAGMFACPLRGGGPAGAGDARGGGGTGPDVVAAAVALAGLTRAGGAAVGSDSGVGSIALMAGEPVRFGLSAAAGRETVGRRVAGERA